MESVGLNLLSSASAGLIARLICHPIDTMKSRLQSGNIEFKSFSKTFMKTMHVEGFRGFYRGLGAVLIGGIPATSLYLTSYEQVKVFLSAGQQKSSFYTYFISGMVAEAISCSVFVPVDVIKERLQVQTSSSLSSSIKSHQHEVYSSSFDAFKTIARGEGFRGVYKGYFATLACFGPFSAIYFMLYDSVKDVILSTWEGGTKTELNFNEALVCAGGSGAVAAFVTSPLDLAKLRMQIGSSKLNMIGSLQSIYFKEGVGGLFRGAGARVLFHTPSTAISMALFESCRRTWSSIIT